MPPIEAAAQAFAQALNQADGAATAEDPMPEPTPAERAQHTRELEGVMRVPPGTVEESQRDDLLRIKRDARHMVAADFASGVSGSPATNGGVLGGAMSPLNVLQSCPRGGLNPDGIEAVVEAAHDLASYHPVMPDQVERYNRLTDALTAFLVNIVTNAPPGPERSTAISRAREAKAWAAMGIAQEHRL